MNETGGATIPFMTISSDLRGPRKKLSLAGGLLALGLGLGSPGLGAWEPLQDGPRIAAPYAYGDDELILEEVFQSHLPDTLKKYNLRLSVHPHLGDWQNNDYMRMTTGLRYGLTDNCELSAASNLFFSHGHGDIRAFDDYGAADFRLGPSERVDVQTAIGTPVAAVERNDRRPFFQKLG